MRHAEKRELGSIPLPQTQPKDFNQKMV